MNSPLLLSEWDTRSFKDQSSNDNLKHENNSNWYTCTSFRLFAENGTLLPSSYTMSSTFNNASMLVNDKTYLDAVIRGLLTEPSQAVDKNVDDSLWNQLFK